VRTASIFRAVNGFNLPDDEDRTHLWNVGLLQRDYTALHPRRL
jgi:hypothetical protein